MLVVRHSLRCDFDLLNSVLWFLTGNWLFSYYFTWIVNDCSLLGLVVTVVKSLLFSGVKEEHLFLLH